MLIRHATVTIRPDLPPERSMPSRSASPSARVSGPPLNPALGFRPVGSSLARPSHRSTPSATLRLSSIQRWKGTIAAQVSAIQREGWRKGLFGRARLSRTNGGVVETTLKRAGQGLARLLVAQSDPASPKPHLHGDSDLAVPPSPGLGRTRRIPALSRLGQFVVLVLLLLGVWELLHTTLDTSRTSSSVRVKGRHPRSVLSDLAPPRSRYTTAVPGMEGHWIDDQASVDPFSDAKPAGDTTAIVLHWKRTENVAVILAHLCRYSFFDSVFVWNNNPDMRLTQQVRCFTASPGALADSSLYRPLPSPAARHRSFASTIRLAICSSSLVTSPAFSHLRQTASSKMTTGLSSPFAPCMPNSAGIRRALSSYTRTRRSLRCTA